MRHNGKCLYARATIIMCARVYLMFQILMLLLRSKLQSNVGFSLNQKPVFLFVYNKFIETLRPLYIP